MIFPRAVYRVQQFGLALWEKPSPADLQSVQELLSPALWRLFTRMPKSEQAHGLRVWHKMIAQSHTEQALQIAALLHDVGKAHIQPWQKALAVLGALFFPKHAQQWGQSAVNNWQQPFVTAENHPAWGANLLAQAGAPPISIKLVRWHQSAPPRNMDAITRTALARLQAADNES